MHRRGSGATPEAARRRRVARLPRIGVGVVMLAALASLPAGADEPGIWLQLRVPATDSVVRSPIRFLEVEGFAGIGPEGRHDVVLVIDASASTALASGIDVDGDGHVGRELRSSRDPLRSPNPRRLSTDPDDTILAAEAQAARRLVHQLDPRRSRVGILRFTGRAEWVATLGSAPEDLDQALADLAGPDFAAGTTNLATALRTATRALAEANPTEGPPPRRWILLLSDGQPSEPPPAGRAADAARGAAEEAARAGVRIRGFAIGAEPAGEALHADLAALTGGSWTRVRTPGAIGLALDGVRLTGVREVVARNATLGRAGRATRLFPDGSFDTVLPLRAGPNRIVVTVRADDGSSASEERRVVFEPRDAGTPEEARTAAATLERLRERTLETELAAEVEAARRAAEHRLLELRPAAPEGASHRNP